MPVCGPELDFTSALFLGLRHPHRALARWDALTTGRPPVLDRHGDGPGPGALAGLLGTEQAVVRRTSLHALLDVLGALAGPGGAVVIDEAAYPVSQWAAAAQATISTHRKGPTVLQYRHHDAGHADALCRRLTPDRPVVVVTDGWCSSCSRPAPLRDLTATARRAGGHLVVDDSLAVGVLRLPALAEAEVVTVASLAKGYGVPLAVIAGSVAGVTRVERASVTTGHASGPTAADLAALQAVLALPPGWFDHRRRRLARLTADLRCRLHRRGLTPVGLPFPFVLADVGHRAVALARSLDRAGVGVLAIDPRCRRASGAVGAPPLLGVALRADHTPADVTALDRALNRVLTAGRAGAAGVRP